MALAGPKVKFVGWLRDMWADPPFLWRQAEKSGREVEAAVMDHLKTMYKDCDTNGNARYSKLALPIGVLPIPPRKDA